MDNRDILNKIRDSLEALSRAVGQYANIVEELEGESEHALKVIQNIIDGMAKQRRLWLTNEMDKLIDNDMVDGGKYNAERLKEIRALFEDFAKWIEKPIVVSYADTELGIPEIAIPPIVIVSRRGNPPKNWGVAPEPKE